MTDLEKQHLATLKRLGNAIAKQVGNNPYAETPKKTQGGFNAVYGELEKLGWSPKEIFEGRRHEGDF